MNTQFNSVPAKTEFPHTYVLTSGKQEKKSNPEEVDSASGRSLTRLQRGRLAAQEAADPYFTGKKPLIGRTVRDLKGEKIVHWEKIEDPRIDLMSKKAIKLLLKKIEREIEWERYSDYLQECRKQLKDNFNQFYVKTQEKQEELKKGRLRNKI